MYMVKCPTMAKYLKKVQELIFSFEKGELKQLSMEENSHADALANIALTVLFTNKRAIRVEFLAELSI